MVDCIALSIRDDLEVYLARKLNDNIIDLRRYTAMQKVSEESGVLPAYEKKVEALRRYTHALHNALEVIKEIESCEMK